MLIIGLACPKPTVPPIKFKLDRPFGLNIGQTCELADSSGLTIRFDKIASDSRCPIGLTCVTAGKADVVITVSKDKASQTVTLPFIQTYGKENVLEFSGYIIRVLGVAPLKVKDVELKPESYAISLSVTLAPPPPPKIKIDKSFPIAVGQSLQLEEDPSSQITLDSILEDSRCPQGVQCIWAGRVDCLFSLTTGGQTQKAALSTGDMSKGGKGEVQFGAYTLKIIGVAPPKNKDQAIPPIDYKVGLVVTK